MCIGQKPELPPSFHSSRTCSPMLHWICPVSCQSIKAQRQEPKPKVWRPPKRASYSRLSPPCFSLTIAFCLDFKLHMWAPPRILSSDTREEDSTWPHPVKIQLLKLTLYSCQMESICAVVFRSATPRQGTVPNCRGSVKRVTARCCVLSEKVCKVSRRGDLEAESQGKWTLVGVQE